MKPDVANQLSLLCIGWLLGLGAVLSGHGAEVTDIPTIRWEFNLQDERGIRWKRWRLGNLELANDGTIYVSSREAEGSFGSPDTNLVGAVYAITKDGKTKWTFEVAGKISSMCLRNEAGGVYVATRTGRVMAIHNGEERWRTKLAHDGGTKVTAMLRGVLAVGDGTVYKIGGEGKVAWRLRSSKPKRAMQAYDTAIAVRKDGGSYILSGPQMFEDRRTLYAISANGEFRWMALLQGSAGNVAVGADAVYVSTGRLVAIEDPN